MKESLYIVRTKKKLTFFSGIKRSQEKKNEGAASKSWSEVHPVREQLLISSPSKVLLHFK